MKHLRKLFSDNRGQDLIEYTLMAAFVAVAALAIMPNVAASLRAIFLKIGAMWDQTPMTIVVSTSDPMASVIRIICAVLAVVCLIIIVMRRKKQAD